MKEVLLATLLSASLVGCLAQRCPDDARAAQNRPTTVKTVRVALTPPDAKVFFQGAAIDHPPGYVDLPGPVGYVYKLEVESREGRNARVTRQIALTEEGASPSAIVLGEATASGVVESDPEVAKLLEESAKLEPWGRGTPPPPASPPTARPTQTRLTVVCQPECTRIVDNGVDLGRSPISDRVVAPGEHTLTVTTGSVTRVVVVAIKPLETRRVLISIPPEQTALELLEGMRP